MHQFQGYLECVPDRHSVGLAADKRDSAIISAGYNLEVTWEHDFRAKHCDSLKTSKSYHMGPHDAYFGGRLEVF